MRLSSLRRALLLVALGLGAQAAAAQAQYQLTFVATTGLDSNGCATPATACRSLQRAHNQTSSGGRVVVLDAGAFGRLFINRSIQVVADRPGNDIGADLLATTVYVSAGPEDDVYLEGLHLRGRGSATDGLGFARGRSLHLRNCVIEGFAGAGVSVGGTAAASRVTVSDCLLRGNRDGVFARAAAGEGALVVLHEVTIESNRRDGIRAEGATTEVQLDNARIVGNARGLRARNGARIVSRGGNLLAGNGSKGAFTATIPPE